MDILLCKLQMFNRKKGPCYSILHAYEFSPTNFFLQLYIVAQGSFVEERQDLDDNSSRTCGAHGKLAMAMKLAL